MKQNVENNLKKLASAIVTELHNGVTANTADAKQAIVEKMLRNLANQAYLLGKNSSIH